ncbi:MAG: class I SAM-dependent methyltransferase [Myxococcota bacterium]
MTRRLVSLEEALAQQQRDFYADAGQAAFAGTVPFRLSTSRAMARLVVQAARAFARALGRPRVRLVDVGAGTGRLAYHVHALAPDIALVLTDASQQMCASLRAHPQLTNASVVHAPADALSDALACAADEALVVVGAYLLDTLPHALLQAPGGQRAFVDASGELSFQAAELDGFSRSYVTRMRTGRAFLPVGAFRFLSHLEASVAAPTLVLLADKMATSLSAAREPDAPRIVRHGAGASVLVNFDALKCWLGWRGVTTAPGGTDDFVVAATVLGGRVAVPDLFQGATHPLAAQAHVTALREASDVASGLLVLEPDGDVLLELADALVAQAARGVSDQVRADLGVWLLDAARGAFFLPADDVAFHAGRALHRLGFAGAAVACFSESLKKHGDEVVTRVFRAAALLELDARDEARADLDLALARDPANAQALSLRAAVGE